MDSVLCILAGGASRRFDGSKLRLRVAGKPVLEHLRTTLTPPGGCAWLSLSPDAELPDGAAGFAQLVRDEEPYAGPLSGLRQVLARAAEELGAAGLLYVTAADALLVSPAHLERLAAALGANPRAPLAMGRWRDGPRAGEAEPLPAVFRPALALPIVEAAWRRGQRSLYRLAQAPEAAAAELDWPVDEAIAMNINTREQYEQAAARGLPLSLPGE